MVNFTGPVSNPRDIALYNKSMKRESLMGYLSILIDRLRPKHPTRSQTLQYYEYYPQ